MEDEYKKQFGAVGLIALRNLILNSKEDKNEMSTLYEIRNRYNEKKIEAFKDEYRIKDSELGEVFDSLDRDELEELNILRKSVGKESITWGN